ncbi:MAG: HlyD family secretion protein [Verrucomicrobia bacterium]|nr:HlyD family secretion protein [Verrucomicrobiota bacterium]
MKAKLFNFAITLIVLLLAGWAAFSLYQRYVQDPWTRDAQVRANVVGIAPRVSGPITRVTVIDNQRLQKGDLLFEIDPTDFKSQVDIAQSQVLNAEANLKQLQQNLDRQIELYRQHVNSLQDLQNAQDTFSAGQAQLASAKANLELAKLNLSYTKVSAPVNGFVTNMNVSPGTYVTAGKQLMALVDTNSYWIAGYFKETQLPHIHPNQKARITALGFNNQPFEAVVEGIGWGIYVQDGSASDPNELLPTVSQTIDWVRLPQRFPVRLRVLGDPPIPLRIGQTVYVAMTREFSAGPGQPANAQR